MGALREHAISLGFLHCRARRLSTGCPQTSRNLLIHGARKMVLMSTANVPRREEMLAALRAAKPLLDSFGVSHVSLFGSFARDEAHHDSDVDVLVEFSRPIGMFEFVRLQRELSECIGRKVELVTRAALKPQLRDRILAEAVLAA